MMKTKGLAFIAMVMMSCTYEVLENTSCNTPPVLEVVSIIGTECGNATGRVETAGTSETGDLTYSIDGITFQTEGVFPNLPASSYTIRVKDSNGCTSSIETVVENLDGVNITAIGTSSGCNTSNGTITVDASGGETPYAFKLNESASQASSLFSNLSKGKYTVVATDAKGCSVEKEITITTGQEFNTIKSIISANCATSSCHGGNVSPDFRDNQNIRNSASKIAVRTANGSMPPSGALSAAQIQSIACWVTDGASIN